MAGIFIEFGTCFCITANKEVFHLDERDLQSKLEPLFKQNLYDIAVRIAKINRYDDEGQSEIYKKYGDYLLTKHNYTGTENNEFMNNEMNSLDLLQAQLISTLGPLATWSHHM